MRCGQLLARVAVTTVLLMGGRLAAATSTYDVTVNTAPLVGHPAGPFSILFAFVDGSGLSDGNNTVSITNVSFGGGNAIGPPALFGGTSGALETGVTLTDSSFLNFFFETFNAGATLRFRVSLTTADDGGLIPDRLTFFILDNSGAAIPTLAPASDFFWGVDLGSNGGSLDAFASDPSRTPSVGSPIVIEAPTALFVTREVKKAERAGLVAVLPTGDSEVDEELHEVIRRVDASLAPNLWADDLHLTENGKRAFDEEERAVNELGEIRNGAASLLSDLRDAARTLTRVDRALAQTALDEGRLAGGDADNLARAQEDLIRGDDLVGQGKFDDAIDRYKDAWLEVRRALHLHDDRDHREEHQDSSHEPARQ
jgi:hypothetical protein